SMGLPFVVLQWWVSVHVRVPLFVPWASHGEQTHASTQGPPLELVVAPPVPDELGPPPFELELGLDALPVPPEPGPIVRPPPDPVVAVSPPPHIVSIRPAPMVQRMSA